MRTKNKTRRLDVSKLTVGAIRQDIEITIGGRFASLSDMRNDAEKEWEHFRDAICKVAEQKIGYKKKIVKNWITPASLAKQEEARQESRDERGSTRQGKARERRCNGSGERHGWSSN